MRNVNTIYNTFLTSTDITKTVPSLESSSPSSESLQREETRTINEKLKTNRGEDEKSKIEVKKELAPLHLEEEEEEQKQEMEELQDYMEHDNIAKHLKLIKRDRAHEDDVNKHTHNTSNVDNKYNTNEFDQNSSAEEVQDEQHHYHNNFMDKRQNVKIDLEQHEEYDELESEESKVHFDNNITTSTEDKNEKKNDISSTSHYNNEDKNENDKYKTKEEEEGEVTQVSVENKLIPPLPFSRLRALHATPTSYTSSRVEEKTTIMISHNNSNNSKGIKLLSLFPSPNLASLEKTPLLTSNLTSLQSSPSTSRVAMTSRTMTRQNNVDDNDKKKGMKMRCDSCSNNNKRKIRIQNSKSDCNDMKSPSEKSSEVRDGRIKVIVRKRPLNVEEQTHGFKDCVRVHDSCQSIQLSLIKQRVDLTSYTENTNYSFDHVFDGSATNVDIHHTCVKELLQVVLNGGRASCFAYGQTGSGKTYTMMGELTNNFNNVNIIRSDYYNINNNKEYMTNECENTKDGLYLLGARELFAQLSPLQCLCVAFYEIYCNSCFDLLNDRQPIVVREDATHKINICHLTWHTLHSMDHLIRLVSVGLEQRRSGSTNANERSSRSHAILSIRVMKRSKNCKINKNEQRKQKNTKEKELEEEQEEEREPVLTSYEYVNCGNKAECVQKQNKTINNDNESDYCKYNEVEEDQVERYEEYNYEHEDYDNEEEGGGIINYVDLAGSERAADTYNEDKTTRKEGAEINKSLLALKECIRALDEKRRHVPFRGCKLTEVLRDSFIGNSRTIMIATISPSAQNYEHSANTLRYAFRVQGLTLANVSPSRARNAPRLTARNVPEHKNKEEEYSKQMIKKKKENKNNNKKEENTDSPLSTDAESKTMALRTSRETASPARLVRRCKSKAKRESTNDKGEAVNEQSSQAIALSSSPLLEGKKSKTNQENKLSQEQEESRMREKPRWNRPTRCISQPERVTDNLRVNSATCSTSTENVACISKEEKKKKSNNIDNNNNKYKKEKSKMEDNDQSSYLKGSNEINTNNDIRTIYTNRINDNSRDSNNNVITISSSSVEHNGRPHDHCHSESNNENENNNSALSPSQGVMLELLSDQSELYSVSNAVNVEFADEKHESEELAEHGQYITPNEKFHHNSNGVNAPMLEANSKDDINCKNNNVVEQIEKQLRSSIMQQVQRDLSYEIQHVLDERDALIASLQAENKELKRRVSELEKITTFSTHDMLANTLPPATHSSSTSSSFYAYKVKKGKNNVGDSECNERSSTQNVTSQNNNYYNINDDEDDDDINFFYYEDDDDDEVEYISEKCNNTTVKYKTNTLTNSHDHLSSPDNRNVNNKEIKSLKSP